MRNNRLKQIFIICGTFIITLTVFRQLASRLPKKIYWAIVVIWVLVWLMFLFYKNVKKKKVIHPVPKESRIDVLRKYAEYDLAQKEKRYSYTFELGNEVPSVLENYGYSGYLKDVEPASDLVAFRLLDFVCDHFHHGNVDFDPDHSLIGVISSCEKNGGKTNCRGLSIILAALLRMNGIKARHVTCKPYEQPFRDCHVVVDCLLPSGKRVMLDPSARLYLKDEKGELVSLERFREGLIKGEDFFENQGATYFGAEYKKESYFEYMSKNLFRFNAALHYADVKDEGKLGEVELIPKDYPIQGFYNKRIFVYHPSVFWNVETS